MQLINDFNYRVKTSQVSLHKKKKLLVKYNKIDKQVHRYPKKIYFYSYLSIVCIEFLPYLYPFKTEKYKNNEL